MMEKEIIPSTWSICRLDEVFQIARGGSPRPIIDYITEGDGYNWIKIGDTKNVDKYIYKTKQKILKGLKKDITNLTHNMSGTKENGMWFNNSLLKFGIGFVCLTYPKSASIDNDFRLDYHTFEANDWLQEKKANN